MAWLRVLSKEGLSDLIEETKKRLEDKKYARDDVGKTWTESKIIDWKRHHDIEIKELEAEIAEMQAELDNAIQY